MVKEEEFIDENDVEVYQLYSEVYRFIQKSKYSNKVVKDFRFKVRKARGSLTAAKVSIIAIIIRKKLNLYASEHIEIVDDNEGNDPEE